MRTRLPQITIDVRLINASGIGTYLRNLLPRIVESKLNWRFRLLGQPEDLAELPWASMDHVVQVRCDAPIYGIIEQLQLASGILRDNDVMWSPHYNVPLLFRGRLLVSIHDVCHLALPHLIRGVHRRAYARWMFSAVRQRADRILCGSEFTKNELCRLVGCARREPIVIHLGVNESWFSIQPEQSPHPRPYILFVGNVKPHKNLGTLIAAFEKIAASIPHDLIIVGKQEGFITNDPKPDLAARALGSRVRFAGAVSQRELEQFFVHADIFVFPSLYEGFGLPPLEAMACGCPTIVAETGSLPEVCGDATLYFDPRNADQLAAIILDLLGHEQARQSLRQRGRQHAARFSWDRSAQRTMAVLEELLSA